MGNELTIDRCLQFLKQITLETTFADKNASEIDLHQKSFRKKLLLISKKDEQVIVVYSGRQYRCLHFQQGVYQGEKNEKDLKQYQDKSYSVSCYKVFLNEFFMWLEQDRFLDEEVTLDLEDIGILNQYKVEVSKDRKTTRRHLRDVKNRIKDEKQKKVIEKKYKLPKKSAKKVPLALEFEEALKEEDIVEIIGKDSQVFTKYGLDVPQKTSYKNFKHTLRSNFKKVLDKTICDEDLEVFRKYGIHFNQSGELVGKVKVPFYKRHQRAFALLCVLFLLTGLWLFYGDRIVPSIIRFFIQRRERGLYQYHYTNLKEYNKKLDQEIVLSRRLYNLLKQYKKLKPSTLKEIEKAASQSKEIAKALKKAKEKMQKKEYAQAIKILQLAKTSYGDRIKFIQQTREFLEQEKAKKISDILKHQEKGKKARSFYREYQGYQKDLQKENSLLQKAFVSLYGSIKQTEEWQQIQESIQKEKLISKDIAKAKQYLKEKKYDKTLEILQESLAAHSEALKSMKNLHQTLHLKQGEKLQLNLKKMQKILSPLQKESRYLVDLYQIFTKEYPANEDYIEPHPRICKLIQGIHQKSQHLRSIFEKIRSMQRQKKFTDAIVYMKKEVLQEDEYQRDLDIALRIKTRLDAMKRANQFLKKEMEKEQKVQKALWTVRNYLFVCQGLWDSIDEHMQNINEQYASYKERFPLDKKLKQSLLDMNQKIKELKSISGKIASLDPKEHYNLLKPYFDLKLSAAEKWRRLETGIQVHIQALEKFKQRNDIQAAVHHQLNGMNTKYQEMEKRRKQIQKQLKKLASKAKYQKVLSQLDSKIDRLQKSLQSVNQLCRDNKFAEASQKLSKIEMDSISKEQNDCFQKISEEIRKAETLKLENSARAKKFAQKHSDMKKYLSQLQSQRKKLEEVQSLFSKKDKKSYKKAEKKYKNSLANLRKAQEKLVNLLNSLDKNIQSKNLKQALSTIENNQKFVQTVSLLPKNYQELIKNFEKAFEKAKQKKQLAKDKKRLKKIIQKLERYTTRLKSIISPIQKDYENLKKLYPVSKGYPSLSDDSQKVLSKAQSKLRSYEKKVQKAKTRLNKKQITKGLKYVVRYEKQKLTDTKFIEDFKIIQNELLTKRTLAEKMSKNLDKIQYVKKLINELEAKRRKLEGVIPALQKNFNLLTQKYPEFKKFANLDANTPKYLLEGKYERNDVIDILQQGRKLLLARNHNRAIAVLKPYVENENSIYPVLKLLLQKSNKILESVADQGYRNQLRQKLNKEANFARNKNRFKQSPGRWYDGLMQTLDQYQNRKAQIDKALNGYGSRIVHTHIENNIRKIKSYTENMGELQAYLQDIKDKGQSIRLSQRLSPYRKKLINDYLEQKTFSLDIQTELSDLNSNIQQLKKELSLGGWIEEKTLRNILRNLKFIDRKYKDKYNTIKSPIVTTHTLLPN